MPLFSMKGQPGAVWNSAEMSNNVKGAGGSRSRNTSSLGLRRFWSIRQGEELAIRIVKSCP
jgi:hypothetical protein